MALTLLAAMAFGCDSAPRTPPMDQPIDRETAMQVDQRMQKSSEQLMKERQDSAQRQ